MWDRAWQFVQRHASFLVTTAALLIILAFLNPPGSASTLGDGWLRATLRIGLYAAIVVSAIIYFARIRFDVFGGLAIAYALAMLLSTFLNGGNLLNCIAIYWPNAAVLLLVRAIAPFKLKELLWAILILMTAYSVINLLSICLLPAGTEHFHPDVNTAFLGHRNSACRSYIPAIVASLLLDALDEKRCSLRTVALFLVGFAHTPLAYSATSLVAMIALVVGLILISRTSARRILNGFTYAGCYLIAFFGIVILRLQYHLSALFETFLGKDASFTGRTEIWDAALSHLQGAHLLYGYCGSSEPLLVCQGVKFNTPHNALLDIVLWGGLLGLATAGGLMALSLENLYKLRTQYSAAVLALSIGVFLLMGISEFIMGVPFCLLLGLAYCWPSSEKPQ